MANWEYTLFSDKPISKTFRAIGVHIVNFGPVPALLACATLIFLLAVAAEHCVFAGQFHNLIGTFPFSILSVVYHASI